MTEPFRVRMVPEVDPDTERFWTSGITGVLTVPRCTACGHHVLPPGPSCRRCRGVALEQVELSGDGVVETFTVNHQPWFEDMDTPVVIAVVQLAEEPGLRLLVTLLDCDPDEAAIGLPVRLEFAPAGDVAVPYARPAGRQARG